MSGSNRPEVDALFERYREETSPGLVFPKNNGNIIEGLENVLEEFTDDGWRTIEAVPVVVTKSHMSELMDVSDDKNTLELAKKNGLIQVVPWSLGKDASYSRYYTFREQTLRVWLRLVRNTTNRWNGDETEEFVWYAKKFLEYSVSDRTPGDLRDSRQKNTVSLDNGFGNNIHAALSRVLGYDCVGYILDFDVELPGRNLELQIFGHNLQRLNGVKERQFRGEVRDCLSRIISRTSAKFDGNDSPSEYRADSEDALKYGPDEFVLTEQSRERVLPTDGSGICDECERIAEQIGLSGATQCLHAKVMHDDPP